MNADTAEYLLYRNARERDRWAWRADALNKLARALREGRDGAAEMALYDERVDLLVATEHQ